MIRLIVGHKGSGKTKRLIDRINLDAKKSEGALVCIDLGTKLTYDINYVVRLVDVQQYHITGYDQLYGFISGLCAANYDITHLYMDSILKIGGRDYAALGKFFTDLSVVLDAANIEMVFTVSCEPEDLPEDIRSMMI